MDVITLSDLETLRPRTTSVELRCRPGVFLKYRALSIAATQWFYSDEARDNKTDFRLLSECVSDPSLTPEEWGLVDPEVYIEAINNVFRNNGWETTLNDDQKIALFIKVREGSILPGDAMAAIEASEGLSHDRENLIEVLTKVALGEVSPTAAFARFQEKPDGRGMETPAIEHGIA